MKLILASVSPRRKELLAPLREFEIQPSDFDETAEGSAEEVVLFNARGKAGEVLSRFPDCMVLGADTVVALDGKILGKPKDAEDAKRMLTMLSGRVHSVFTGVCLIDKKGALEQVVETKVLFKTLSENFIEEYVLSGTPLDKAGAYGIQDGLVVDCYEGSYSNVMGLPIEAVEEMLKQKERV